MPNWNRICVTELDYSPLNVLMADVLQFAIRLRQLLSVQTSSINVRNQTITNGLKLNYFMDRH